MMAVYGGGGMVVAGVVLLDLEGERESGEGRISSEYGNIR